MEGQEEDRLQVALPVSDGLNNLVIVVLGDLVGGGGHLREGLLEV